ncbi:SPOSA6832_02158 [Sporobolomyces salmonicolor]|uniref:SPOSA6832_02158-mRNA-1:cds n=1 Tax=Sporidiobolus salmonicolor TaxID=5005 RepID=A0A0D6EL79_SPOSA|nr:SPOSA6832_02158 [Sporobolomyces salmonicolor]
MAGFGSLYVVGSSRLLYSYGLYNGGPVALWTGMVVTTIFMCITAASFAEICSSIPLSGSIYVWAAEAGGKKYGRLFGFIVAYWASTAWTSFVASNTQGTTNYMLAELTVFNSYFPGGGLDDSNVKFRAVQWACSEVFLLGAIMSNLLSRALPSPLLGLNGADDFPPVAKNFTWIFKASAAIIFIDFMLTIIWLPVGVSKTYGFQSAKWVFTEYYNGSGAVRSFREPRLYLLNKADPLAHQPDVWNFMLVYLSTSGVVTGWDASGHIAEETKNASVASARGMFWSCAASGILSIPLIILFSFCSPDLDTLFNIYSPQPFTNIYQMALGKGGGMVMTIVAIVGLFINTSLAVTAASRLVFAIARDGILPGSSWIGKVDKNGQPKNAIIFIGAIAAILLCTILPSSVAFTSLISLPVVVAEGGNGLTLRSSRRLIFTRGDFANAKWSNGRWSVPFCIISVIFNSTLALSHRKVAEECSLTPFAFFLSAFLLAVLLSPLEFPVNAQNMNFACAIFGGVTIFGLISYWIVPEEKWLAARQVRQMLDAAHAQQVAHKTDDVEQAGTADHAESQAKTSALDHSA